jgi:hypothetical protein
MKVIGAGFPRTGTSTLQTVLNQLGFGPCYHMREVVEHPDHADRWVAGLAGEPIDLQAALAGYESTTDAPGCHFWRELRELYPDAKVLLSLRDPAKWYQSMIKTVLNEDLFQDLDSTGATGARRLAPMMFDRVFGSSRDEAHLTEVFNEHNAAVRREVPADKLLVYDVSEGWEPLCAFLEVPVPDEPFPWLNDSASFVRTVEEFQQRQR